MSGQPRLNVSARAKIAVALLETTPAATVAEVSALVRVGESTVYRAWNHTHPDGPPRGRRITDEMRSLAIEPFAALCDVLAAQLSDRPQSAAQVFASTLTVQPGVGNRRLWRALARLIDTRRAHRHGPRCSGAMYTAGEELAP